MLAYFCRAAAGCFSWAGLLEKREAKKKKLDFFSLYSQRKDDTGAGRWMVIALWESI